MAIRGRIPAAAWAMSIVAISACAGSDNSATAGVNPTAEPEATAPVTAAGESGTGSATTAAPITTPTTSAVTTTIAPATTSTTVSTSDDEEIDINHLQVLGSHNSFHLLPPPALFDGIAALSPELAADIEYAHLPLAEQLESYGVRQFEIDVFADPNGGLFANRAANAVVGIEPASGLVELDAPGFKVLHTQDFDYETTCLTLVICLTEIAEWSAAHPTHVPVMIMLEMKELSVPDAAAEEGIELTIDLPWAEPFEMTPDLLDALDAEIRSVFSPEQIIEPDDVRGDAATLEDAVLTTGWPTLEASRGKVIFSMTNEDVVHDMYVVDAPSLEGRPIFTTSTPGDPDAAFVRFDDPSDPGLDAAAAAGYLVRTRTDSPTQDARDRETTKRELALAGGAHYLSTDYYAPSEFFESDYVVALPNGVVARCNPVTAPANCADELLAE